MKLVELVATVIAEAKGIPAPLIATTVAGMVPTMIQGAMMAGERVEELLKEVAPADARRILQECRDDKKGTLKQVAEWEAEGPKVFATIERRQRAIAKKVLNAR